MKLDTLAVHAGYETDPTTKSVAVPIYQTVSYEFDDAQHGAAAAVAIINSVPAGRLAGWLDWLAGCTAGCAGLLRWLAGCWPKGYYQYSCTCSS